MGRKAEETPQHYMKLNSEEAGELCQKMIIERFEEMVDMGFPASTVNTIALLLCIQGMENEHGYSKCDEWLDITIKSAKEIRDGTAPA